MFFLAVDFSTMEKLTNLSKLTVDEKTICHLIPDTLIGYREIYRATVNPTTTVDENLDSISFNVLPNQVAEMAVNDCYLNITFKCKKANANLPETDQVSICNFPAVLAWDYCKLFIAGEEVSKTRITVLTNLYTDYFTDQPTDRPTNRPTDQPTDRPTNRPTDQPTNQPLTLR